MAAEQDRDAAIVALGTAKLDVGARAEIAARCATAEARLPHRFRHCGQTRPKKPPNINVYRLVAKNWIVKRRVLLMP